MEDYTSHVDTFARDNLPPKSEWPDLDYSGIPELSYAERMNCGVELLDKMVADGFAKAPLFHTEDGVWTYEETLHKVNQIAKVLTEDMGLKPGNRVLLRGPNTPMLSACWFAVVRAGGICVTTMPLLRSKELSFIIEKSEIDLALCDARWDEELIKTQQVTQHLKHVMYFLGSDENSLDKALKSKDDDFYPVDTSADDVVLIAFTSGTTGHPKATMHFHRDVMAICDCFPRYALKPKSSDVFCGTPPFAFTFGLGALLLFPMRFGASIALTEKPGLDTLLETIQKYKATICFTSPTAYRAVMDNMQEYNISSLRKCVSAGEPLPKSTFEAWKEKTGIKIIDGIGATEMLHIFISAPEDEICPGATGKALPGYQARVVDGGGDDLPAGEVGLLAVKGPTGCRYLADDRQREYVKDGWNYTGDAYLMDQNGYFWFQARADDMIISGGYNISGLEVENALLTHPEVKECGVVAAPDNDRGNIVKAFVVLKDSNKKGSDTAKLLQDYVKQEIAPYKYPRAVEFVESLPRTETGKLQRFKLRS